MLCHKFRLTEYKLHYGLFSKVGFNKDLQQRAANDAVMLFEGVSRPVR